MAAYLFGTGQFTTENTFSGRLGQSVIRVGKQDVTRSSGTEYTSTNNDTHNRVCTGITQPGFLESLGLETSRKGSGSNNPTYNKKIK